MYKKNSHYYQNLEFDSLMKFEEMELYQPTEEWKPKHFTDAQRIMKERKLAARDLTMGDHFTRSRIVGLDGVVDGMKAFLESLRPILTSVYSVHTSFESIQAQLLVVSGDIVQSRDLLYKARKQKYDLYQLS